MGDTGGGGGEVVIGCDEKENGGGGGEVFEDDRSSGGNRWPRQETIALLQIRCDMDGVFRDSSLKGPLWEQVSRKLEELGYHRSAKKCKEKFENVYKYHKRTKDGRVGKSDGKTYRFFQQLEALEHHHQQLLGGPTSLPSLPPLHQSRASHNQQAVPVTMVVPACASTSVTVPSSSHSISFVHVNPTHQIPPVVPPQQVMPVVHPSLIQMENSTPSSPSATAAPSPSPSLSSTSSDEELMGNQRNRKRKWKDFFERMRKVMMDKQEELQKRFLEVVEKREHDRMARDEAWKIQELSRLNRVHEIRAQERSMAAAKDAALISFLHKLSDQQQIPFQLPAQIQTQTQTCGASPVVPVATTNQTQTQSRVEESLMTLPPTPELMNQLPIQQAMVVAASNVIIPTSNMDVQKTIGNGDSQYYNLLHAAGSSRWPKAEVEALINLRTSLDQKYQENGPKGPLWQEISAAMKNIGYNRNSNRCKQKWENINKYFKKVKESNKRRPGDSKTCPYFHQLDALYRVKNKSEVATDKSTFGGVASYPVAPIMARPEQQWPIQPAHHDNGLGSDNSDEDLGEEDDDDDDDDVGNGYEIVANNAGGSMTQPRQ